MILASNSMGFIVYSSFIIRLKTFSAHEVAAGRKSSLICVDHLLMHEELRSRSPCIHMNLHFHSPNSIRKRKYLSLYRSVVISNPQHNLEFELANPERINIKKLEHVTLGTESNPY